MPASERAALPLRTRTGLPAAPSAGRVACGPARAQQASAVGSGPRRLGAPQDRVDPGQPAVGLAEPRRRRASRRPSRARSAATAQVRNRDAGDRRTAAGSLTSLSRLLGRGRARAGARRRVGRAGGDLAVQRQFRADELFQPIDQAPAAAVPGRRRSGRFARLSAAAARGRGRSACVRRRRPAHCGRRGRSGVPRSSVERRGRPAQSPPQPPSRTTAPDGELAHGGLSAGGLAEPAGERPGGAKRPAERQLGDHRHVIGRLVEAAGVLVE